MPNFWWVNQGQSYETEESGGYIWAPTKTKKGNPVAHHVNVSRVAPGDIVVHYANGSIRAIGVVEENLGTQDRPSELAAELWEREGYLARVRYHEVDHPIALEEVANRPPGGPFNRTGGVNQGYLFELPRPFARSLYRQFRDRWPIQWTEDVDPWDEYVFWVKKCIEWPGFDAAERDYKEEFAERLRQVRSSFLAGSEDWPALLRKILPAQNMTVWQVHDPVLKWIQANPRDARAALGELWADDEPTPEGVRSFVEALAEIPGVSGKITLASVLLMAIDPHLFPPYRRRAFRKSYELTGFATAGTESDAGTTWQRQRRFWTR